MADIIIKKLVLANKVVSKSRVVILGITFKENCPDARNSKVKDIIVRLNEFGIKPTVVDPQADSVDVECEYGVKLVSIDTVIDVDCVVFAVAHNDFKEMSIPQIDRLFRNCSNEEKVIIDIKSILNKAEVEKLGYSYWRF